MAFDQLVKTSVASGAIYGRIGKNGLIFGWASVKMLFQTVFFFFRDGLYPPLVMYPALFMTAVYLAHFTWGLITNGFTWAWLLTLTASGFLLFVVTGVCKFAYNFVKWCPGAGSMRKRSKVDVGLHSLKDSKLAPVANLVDSFITPSNDGVAVVAGGNIGKAAKADETFVRGAALIDAPKLARLIASTMPAEWMEYLVKLGGVPLPHKDEPKHYLVAGRTGSGKTQAINSMLMMAQKRGNAALVADSGGGFLSRFGRETDIVLNPFDARCAPWSVFAEIENDFDIPRIAKAAIPDGHGDSKEWHFYAQSLFGEVLRALHRQGKHSTRELLRYVQAADTDELGKLVAGTAAEILTKRGNEKMLSNTRAIASLSLATWAYLPDNGTFSVRQWVRDCDKANPRWLFMTHRDDQMEMLKSLIGCWEELAIVEGLSLPEKNDRRLWYVFDELDSLGKVSSLRAGLTKLRKYGGVVVCGIQSISQLRTTYGKDEAQTLLSCLSSKMILAAGDAETAAYFEKELGQQEIKRQETSEGSNTGLSSGGLSSGDNNSTSIRNHTQAAVMASEIANLPDLVGYLKLIEWPAAKIQLQYIGLPQKLPAFISKKGN